MLHDALHRSVQHLLGRDAVPGDKVGGGAEIADGQGKMAVRADKNLAAEFPGQAGDIVAMGQILFTLFVLYRNRLVLLGLPKMNQYF